MQSILIFTGCPVSAVHHIVPNFYAVFKMIIGNNIIEILPFTRTVSGLYYRFRMQNTIWKNLLLGKLSSRIRLD